MNVIARVANQPSPNVCIILFQQPDVHASFPLMLVHEAIFHPSNDSADLRLHVVALKKEHRVLDKEIRQLSSQHGRDQLTLQRLKKRKLFLRDEIKRLQSKLVPDIIA